MREQVGLDRNNNTTRGGLARASGRGAQRMSARQATAQATTDQRKREQEAEQKRQATIRSAQGSYFSANQLIARGDRELATARLRANVQKLQETIGSRRERGRDTREWQRELQRTNAVLRNISAGSGTLSVNEATSIAAARHPRDRRSEARIAALRNLGRQEEASQLIQREFASRRAAEQTQRAMSDAGFEGSPHEFRQFQQGQTQQARQADRDAFLLGQKKIKPTNATPEQIRAAEQRAIRSGSAVFVDPVTGREMGQVGNVVFGVRTPQEAASVRQQSSSFYVPPSPEQRLTADVRSSRRRAGQVEGFDSPTNLALQTITSRQPAQSSSSRDRGFLSLERFEGRVDAAVSRRDAFFSSPGVQRIRDLADTPVRDLLPVRRAREASARIDSDSGFLGGFREGVRQRGRSGEQVFASVPTPNVLRTPEAQMTGLRAKNFGVRTGQEARFFALGGGIVVGGALALSAENVALTAQAPFIPEVRPQVLPELGRAGRETVSVFDPRTPEGAAGLGLSLVGGVGLGAVRAGAMRQQGITTAPLRGDTPVRFGSVSRLEGFSQAPLMPNNPLSPRTVTRLEFPERVTGVQRFTRGRRADTEITIQPSGAVTRRTKVGDDVFELRTVPGAESSVLREFRGGRLVRERSVRSPEGPGLFDQPTLLADTVLSQEVVQPLPNVLAQQRFDRSVFDIQQPMGRQMLSGQLTQERVVRSVTAAAPAQRTTGTSLLQARVPSGVEQLGFFPTGVELVNTRLSIGGVRGSGGEVVSRNLMDFSSEPITVLPSGRLERTALIEQSVSSPGRMRSSFELETVTQGDLVLRRQSVRERVRGVDVSGGAPFIGLGVAGEFFFGSPGLATAGLTSVFARPKTPRPTVPSRPRTPSISRQFVPEIMSRPQTRLPLPRISTARRSRINTVVARDLRSTSASRISSVQTPKSMLDPMQTPAQRRIPVQRIDTSIALTPKIVQRTTTTRRGSFFFTGGTPRTGPFPRLRDTPPPKIRFGLPGGIVGGVRRRDSGRISGFDDYTPSFVAVDQKIFGSAPIVRGGFTGLEFRPIVARRSR